MPTTLAGLLIFTALILPGFAFIATYTFDRPRRRLSTLEATAAIVTASLVAELAAAEDERDEEIRLLMGAKVRVAEIATAAGLHVQRVYQIRDGRR